MTDTNTDLVSIISKELKDRIDAELRKTLMEMEMDSNHLLFSSKDIHNYNKVLLKKLKRILLEKVDRLVYSDDTAGNRIIGFGNYNELIPIYLIEDVKSSQLIKVINFDKVTVPLNPIDLFIGMRTIRTLLVILNNKNKDPFNETLNFINSLISGITIRNVGPTKSDINESIPEYCVAKININI